MDSSHLSEQDILDRMRRAIRESGKGPAPGEAAFAKPPWNVPVNAVKRYWPTHSALIIAAGGVPNEPKRLIPDPELFREYVKVCRYWKKIPTLDELRIATRKLGTRTHKVQSRGGLEAFNKRFRQWLGTPSGEEFAEILDFPGWGRKPFGTGTRVTGKISPVTAGRYSYLPVGLLHLSTLASNRLPPELDGEASASLLFEKRCAQAFRALGFQVRPLGQGKGRKADCLALARAERFGVIIDAKARAEGFALGTEDRKLREYAETQSDDLRGEAIERVYLCVVSSSFREEDVERVRHALTGLDVHGWSLWPADVLMATVERSIAERSEFRLKDLEEWYRLNSIVTQQPLAAGRASRRR